jgi:hypothetical protein
MAKFAELGISAFCKKQSAAYSAPIMAPRTKFFVLFLIAAKKGALRPSSRSFVYRQDGHELSC